MPEITPFLWFDDRAHEAARFYVSVFPNSRILRTAPRNSAIPVEAGPVLTVEFELDGRRFIGFNGGPALRFTEAVSIWVACRTQDEIDRYWEALSEGGAPSRCGWLKDRFGLSWQITPHDLLALLRGPNAERVTAAVMGMTRLDGDALRAAAGDRTGERNEP